MSEFGRTPVSEGANGRDHSRRGFSLRVAGGGFRTGHVHGASDEFGCDAIEHIVPVHDRHATLLSALGLDHRRLTFEFGGRQESLTEPDVSDARIVRELLA